MASPLGPTLANFFQGAVETKLLTQNLEFSPKTFFEITKQLFAIFEKQKSCSEFLNALNHQQKNLKFTMEKSIGLFPFLDIQINISQNTLETRILN